MLAIVTLAAALATAPRPGDLKSFGDWAVGCDNGRACMAVALMEMETGENQLMVEISREAGAKAAPRIRIPNIELNDPGAQVSVVLDNGKTAATTQLPKDGGALLLQTDLPLITNLVAAQRLTLQDGKRRALGTASLKGLAQALDYIDTQQGRSGTQGALVRRGSIPDTQVPKPPALPLVAAVKRARVETQALGVDDVARLQKHIGCDASGEPPRPLEASRIDDRNWLVLLPCGSSPYNSVTAPVLISSTFLGKGRRMKIAEFDILPGLGQADGLPLLSNAVWDGPAGELASFTKGRGLGDCGSAETYIWDGRRFRMITQVAMAECRGVLDWIPTWRATVRPR